MALTKAEMAEHLFEELGLNKREAKDMVEMFFEEIRMSLELGRQVKLSGFGNFKSLVVKRFGQVCRFREADTGPGARGIPVTRAKGEAANGRSDDDAQRCRDTSRQVDLAGFSEPLAEYHYIHRVVPESLSINL